MSGFGARAYSSVAADSGVKSADPHQMVLLLFDGALAAIRQAQGLLHSGQVAAKCAAIGKAIRIVDEGLKVSLDLSAGGVLAQRLAALYDYATLRLLQANLRNDDRALDEVARLLSDLRAAWAQIGAQAAAASVPAASVAAAEAARADAAAAASSAAGGVGAAGPRFFDETQRSAVRRLAVSA